MISNGKIEKRGIAIFCDYIPHEILHAAGLISQRVSGDGKVTRKARSVFPTYMCSYAMNCIYSIWANLIEYQGFVFANSCHAMETLHEFIREYVQGKPVIIIDVPRKSDPSAVEFYTSELSKFKEIIEEKFLVQISDEKLRESIRLSNIKRRLVLEIENLIINKKLLLTANEMISLNNCATINSEEFINKATQIVNIGAVQDNILKSGPRILVSGSIHTPMDIVQLVQEYGGKVVTCDNCNSFRSLIGEIDCDEEPIRAIAQRYLRKRSCARQTDINQRITELVNLVNNYKIDGVILSVVKFCPDQAYWIITMADELKRRDIPFLIIDDEYSSESSGQIHTRVQAFLERF